MADKKITIEKLAVIINKGFQGQMDYMEKKFAQVASKKELDEIKKDVEYIKENLDDAEKLGKRIDYIETILDLPAIKKS